jgi:quercetin dioxygenase-like cupin family protein/ribosome-associated toxin RatA of RatAB toxin-antitoxin module
MAGHTDNTIVIDAPLDYVWRITNEVRDWPQLFTEYSSAEILEEEPGRILFRLSTHPDENGKVWSWVSERRPDPATHVVSAHRVETGPFEYMNIRWTYEADGEDATRMRWVQDFHMNPGAPLDDAGMVDYINNNSAIQMKTIKEKVEARKRHVVAAGTLPANRKRGGDIRTVLSPATVGSTTGFLGTLTMEPGEVVTEHYHPYSEEFLFVVQGAMTVRLDGVHHLVHAEEGIWIPIGMRHRVTNDGADTARAVFHLAPLAPRPDMGHVDTEPLPGADTVEPAPEGTP